MKEFFLDLFDKTKAFYAIFEDKIRWQYISDTKKRIIVVTTAIFTLLVITLIVMASIPEKKPTYRPKINKLAQIDEDGNRWLLSLEKGQKNPSISTDIKVGPPLTVTSDVKIIGRNVTIDLEVLGQANEKYVGAALKNDRWPPPPSYKIVDEFDKTLASGSFKYG